MHGVSLRLFTWLSGERAKDQWELNLFIAAKDSELDGATNFKVSSDPC